MKTAALLFAAVLTQSSECSLSAVSEGNPVTNKQTDSSTVTGLGIHVGPSANGAQTIPSEQVLRSAGQQLRFPGRPVDLALSSDGRTLFIKNTSDLLVVDAASWRIKQSLKYPGDGASMHGIAVNTAGSHVYVTGAGNQLYEWRIGLAPVASFTRTISLPVGSYPCGVALSRDSQRAWVCLSVSNQLALVELRSGIVTHTIAVGVAPWDVVLSPDEKTAYVSDWGGRIAGPGEFSANSAGTPVVVDARGVASKGYVSIVDLVRGKETAKVETGLHPCDLVLSSDGRTLFVANANSDTVTVIDTRRACVIETIQVRPDPSFPFGSAVDALALNRKGDQLFVACGGNNALAVLDLAPGGPSGSRIQGLIPTDWFPGAVAADRDFLYVVNVKGLGSRHSQSTNEGWGIDAYLGTANKIPIPGSKALRRLTDQVRQNGREQEIRDALKPARPGCVPVPIPARAGEPSVFQHVLYILKENKTYDQVLGDMPQGNGNSNLCIYPEFVTPNHHALAREYVLLDNFYCNGVLSADGHSWSTEGNCTDHLEKSFGGFTRSYTFGDDPLTYSSTGFIWNNALEHGLTFRNYGEMDYASTSPAATWLQIYQDHTNRAGAIRYVQNIGIASLRPYSSTNVPGWNLGIPDVVRADGFIRELKMAEPSGNWAAFHLLYLPNDHAGGPPSPRAQVADNDLALGRVVEAVTRSVFAATTVIFVIEDDPQSGYDHVDAHRSLCLVISPYTRRRAVLHNFYNQAGVIHTMEQILGLPPMNQQDAMAPLLFECFTNLPNFSAYTALPNNIPLTEGVAKSAKLSRKEKYWMKKVGQMDFSRPDRINEDVFNRYIWYTLKGEAPYPAKYVGGHGKGLGKLGLVRVRETRDLDD